MSENTISAEGRTVREAIKAAAATLGIDARLVDHKIDMSHFRNADGRVIPQDTVKIIAWAGDPEVMEKRAAQRRAQLEAAANAPRDDFRSRDRDDRGGRDDRSRGRDRDDRRGRDRDRDRDARDDRRPRGRDRDDRPAFDGDDSGAVAGKEWLEGLLGHMGVEATVKARAVGENEAVIDIDSPKARHLVGRRGANLLAIRGLFRSVMERQGQGDWSFDINVEGGRDRDDRRERRDRDDRRDRDRGSRDRDRDGGRERRSERDIDRLKTLAKRLAQEAIDTGETVAIRKELNSFERRMVHMTLSDFPGVKTKSDGDGAHKQVLIIPVGGGEE